MDGNTQAPQDQSRWQFQSEQPMQVLGQHLGQTAVAAPDAGPTLVWTASEFIAHHKTTGWYGALAGGAVVISVALYFMTKDIVTSIFIIIAAGIFAAFAGRQPRELNYRISNTGVSIGQRYHQFTDFKSFSIMREGAFSSVVFVPMQRFAPLITMYYDPRQEQPIVEAISRHLPMEQRKTDPIDRLMWRMRF